MYQGPSASTENRNSEDYLLGKIYNPSNNGSNNNEPIGSTKNPGALWQNQQISNKNDTFTRLHEDPMIEIKKNEKMVNFE